MDDLIGKRINSIKTDSQTHHIELSTRIAFYPGCITDMTQYLMLKSLLQTFRSSFKHFYLSARKRIKLSPVTAYQMGEYRTWNNSCLLFQTVYQFRNLFGCKTQTVHSRIQFNMNGEIRYPFFFGSFNQFIQ